MTSCLRQALNSSTAPFITPWSVSPSAGWPNSAARAASLSILHAPSSSEYSEWTWRWAQAGVLTGGGRLDPRRTMPTARARGGPARCGISAARSRPCARSVQLFRSATAARSPRTAGARRSAGSPREQVREGGARHRDDGVGRLRGRAPLDRDRRAVADRDVPAQRARAGDLLGDRERVALGPGRVDRVGERAEDEVGVEVRAGPRARPPRSRPAPASASRSASASRRRPWTWTEPIQRPMPLLHAGEQLGERDDVGGDVERRPRRAAAARRSSARPRPARRR